MTTAAQKKARLDQQAPVAPVGIPGAKPIIITGSSSIQFPKYKPCLSDIEKIMRLLEFPNLVESSCLALKVMDSKLTAQVDWSLSFSQQYLSGYTEQEMKDFAQTTIIRLSHLLEEDAFAEARIAACEKVMRGSFDPNNWIAISDSAVNLIVKLDFTNLKNWQRAEPVFSSRLR